MPRKMSDLTRCFRERGEAIHLSTARSFTQVHPGGMAL